MADFAYRAVDRNGQPQRGAISAETREAALRQLRTQGLTPLEIHAASGAALAAAQASTQARPRGGQKVRIEDLLSVTSELAVLLRAGLPLDRALKVLLGFVQHPRLAMALGEVLETVKRGKSLSQALAMHQDIFGDFYLNMIRAAEVGGQLTEALERLTEHLERLKQLRQSIVSALIYPAILVFVALISIGLMLAFVVPQFESLFSDMGDALPTPTRMILASAHFLQNWGWAALLVGGLIALVLRHWLQTSAGRAWRDRTLLGLPLFGALIRKYEITRFARSMGTLLGNGVSILEALRIATQSIDNQVIQNALSSLPSRIKQGGRIADGLEQTGVIPPLGLHMIKVGEESGRLDAMFLELARVYDEQVQSGIKRTLTLLEPILILTLGAIIALIIISILMGILSVNELAV